jgi:addiction module RelE/StbE family toxin
MNVRFHKKFEKKFAKLPKKIQDKFYTRLKIFTKNPYDSTLNNHPVDPEYPGWRSINITGDYRALFDIVSDDLIVFMIIGSHSELY